jgi:hypothetical protein
MRAQHIPPHIKEAIASLSNSKDDNKKLISSSILVLQQHAEAACDSSDVLLALQKAVVCSLNIVQDKQLIEDILRLADICFKGTQQAQLVVPSSCLVVLYSYIRKLVSLKQYSKALWHGKQLLAALQATQAAEGTGLDDIVIGGCLNVIICSSEGAQLVELDTVNQAAVWLLETLR